jgi:hypothetical protein
MGYLKTGRSQHGQGLAVLQLAPDRACQHRRDLLRVCKTSMRRSQVWSGNPGRPTARYRPSAARAVAATAAVATVSARRRFAVPGRGQRGEAGCRRLRPCGRKASSSSSPRSFSRSSSASSASGFVTRIRMGRAARSAEPEVRQRCRQPGGVRKQSWGRISRSGGPGRGARCRG